VFVQIMHDRARQMIGQSATALVAAASGAVAARDGEGLYGRFDFRQGLGDLASRILEPAAAAGGPAAALATSSSSSSSSSSSFTGDNRLLTLPRPQYRYSAPSKITLTRASTASTVATTWSPATILPERAFLSGIGDSGTLPLLLAPACCSCVVF
jgi:hypothetical protein